MAKSMFVVIVLMAILSICKGFTISPFGIANELSHSTTSLNAKHVQKKATKKHIDRRPKKKRPSDKNRKPTVYALDSFVKPPEYTILAEGEE
mmetsp:Transcript_22500/g.22822  ORF Transcript_22500/g.22822 Transcript_22500/m.22822 type:complete len:92 (-) Transcript_22500:217-492(-)|eukprot:CAMPEP_0171293338 /NCGR_PEP_ID=MMETSP0816-20121228/1518_1 /TAXON_ID=420281 /ORGANISM="Proboscia inermis, Strain CCAP1064/1" /LENGTH=91 /DNA_ID=CAMNT_0011764053 /DNA_START=97 /DNA_END=372 /DNA_ORIENTATION=+